MRSKTRVGTDSGRADVFVNIIDGKIRALIYMIDYIGELLVNFILIIYSILILLILIFISNSKEILYYKPYILIKDNENMELAKNLLKRYKTDKVIQFLKQHGRV